MFSCWFKTESSKKSKGQHRLKNIVKHKIINAVLNNDIDVSYAVSPSEEKVLFRHHTSFNNHKVKQSELPIIWLTTSMGTRIPAAFLKKKGAQQTILYSHGNAEDMGNSLRYAKYLQEKLDVHVMVYEYTGFGHAETPPLVNRVRCTEKHIYADIKAAYRWLLEYGIKTRDIILVGRSMGTGPSVELAVTEQVGGLVLISAIASVLRVASPWLPFTLKGLDMFTNIDKMSRVTCPVLSVHGRQDQTSPFKHGKALFDAADVQAYMPFWHESADHNDVENANWDELCKYYKEFLACIDTNCLTPRSSERSFDRYTFDNSKSSAK